MFDDVMDEVSSNAEVSKLFTRGRSHLGCSLILMLQNIFPNGKHSRTISIDAQYQTLFRNPRDSLQISTLARQLCPMKSRDFLKMYKKATKRPYGYLFSVLLNHVQTKFVSELIFFWTSIRSLFISYEHCKEYCFPRNVTTQ